MSRFRGLMMSAPRQLQRQRNRLISYLSSVSMAANTNPRPPRRYPAARSKSKVPCLEYPSRLAPSESRQSLRRYLIFFIPGNPGLANYYVPFLQTLRELLDETEQAQKQFQFDIYATNLLGFNDADHEVGFGADGDADNVPFCLEDQICWVEDVVADFCSGEERTGYDHVILMGHSVGAYIATEVFHRHHLALQHGQKDKSDGDGSLGPVNLKAGIMLFPTVWDIAKSPNGRKLDMLRRSGYFDRYGHHAARWIVSRFPRWVLEDVIIRRVMGFSPEGAAVTADFVTSRDGIWQSLHLAKDEMASITDEKWEEEMWEMADEVDSGDVDKFYFLFGSRDRWVADETRDAFIEKRKGHPDGRVRIVVDDGGLPHAFCIHHSEIVAERVRNWVDEIAGAS